MLLGGQQDAYNFVLWQEGLQRAEVTTHNLLGVSEAQDRRTLRLSLADPRDDHGTTHGG